MIVDIGSEFGATGMLSFEDPGDSQDSQDTGEGADRIALDGKRVV